MINLMLLLQGLACWNYFAYDSPIFYSCEMSQVILGSISYGLFMIVVQIFAFQYLYMADIIFQFSMKGVLPTLLSKQRHLKVLMVVAVMACVVEVVFVIGAIILSDRVETF